MENKEMVYRQHLRRCAGFLTLAANLLETYNSNTNQDALRQEVREIEILLQSLDALQPLIEAGKKNL